MDNSFVKFSRKIENWEWYKDVATFKLFFHLVTFSNFAQGKFEGKTIERGQYVSSYRQLSTKTGLSEKQVRTAVKHLKTTGEVAQVTYPKFSVFTVVNYDKYQNGAQSWAGKGHSRGTQRAQEGQQYKKNKKNKEEKEKKKPPAGGGFFDFDSIEGSKSSGDYWGLGPKLKKESEGM